VRSVFAAAAAHTHVPASWEQASVDRPKSASDTSMLR
jgi:hypothetical protein